MEFDLLIPQNNNAEAKLPRAFLSEYNAEQAPRASSQMLGNERELARRAAELNHQRVIFLKELNSHKEVIQYASTLKNLNLPVDFGVGLLVKPTKRKDLDKIKNLHGAVEVVVVMSDGSEQVNRAVVETSRIDYVFNLASATGRDHTHYRRGGVNQVIAKLMVENGMKYGLSFSRFLSEKQRRIKDSASIPSGIQGRRIRLLGRWIFNAKVFRKYNVPVEVFSMASEVWDVRSPDALGAFGRIVAP